MSTFTETFQDIWATRPPRIPKKQGGNAYFGGVCEGLGARYRIDPTLLRILFVVTFFAWGSSLLIYLLFMLVMPRYGMTKSPWDTLNANNESLNPTEQSERSTAWVLTVFVSLMFIGLLSGLGASASSLTGLFTFAAFGAALYFLHQRTPEPPAGLLADPPQHQQDPNQESTTPDPAAASATQTQDFSNLRPVDGYPHPDVGRTTPPAWDPLGTVPELWDLPDPAQPEPVQTKKSSTPWIRTIGITTIVILILSATGFGIIRSATSDEDFGSQMVTMSTEAELTDVRHEVGTVQVDLRDLPPLDEDHTINVESRIGSVEVIPSTNARTQFECTTDLGSENCPALVNADAKGGTLTIRVHNDLGEIAVLH